MLSDSHSNNEINKINKSYYWYVLWAKKQAYLCWTKRAVSLSLFTRIVLATLPKPRPVAPPSQLCSFRSDRFNAKSRQSNCTYFILSFWKSYASMNWEEVSLAHLDHKLQHLELNYSDLKARSQQTYTVWTKSKMFFCAPPRWLTN